MLRSRLLFHLCNKSLQQKRFYSKTSRTKICIIGSGPAGFYTAQNLLKGDAFEVDIFEKLPAPYGLIRYGVAPDHPEIKNVTCAFEQTAEKKLCNFYGNVNVGKDITIDELSKAYHAIVLAYGADIDRTLDIPGEDSKNVLSANQFVSWFNGHPDFTNVDVKLDSEHALVIGHGNVAIDVARILLLDFDVLAKTDMTEHALEVFANNKVKKVTILGRRGPLEVSFATKELRDLTQVHNCNCIINKEVFEGFPELIPNLERPRKRLTELLYTTAFADKVEAKTKSCEIKFYRNPKAILPDSQGTVEKVVFGINKLKKLDIKEPAEILDTGKEEIINSSLVIKSIGFKSSLIDSSIPFDHKRCVVPNQKGRVLGRKDMYCSGWIKMGARGVILPTMYSSFETVDAMLQDIEKGKLSDKSTISRDYVKDLLKKRGVRYITFKDWKKIDQIEENRGKSKGKPREKICSLDEILSLLNK